MASLLASRGVTLDFVVDEGGPILIDGLPSLLQTSTQIALVGTAEKVTPPMTTCKGRRYYGMCCSGVCNIMQEKKCRHVGAEA